LFPQNTEMPGFVGEYKASDQEARMPPDHEINCHLVNFFIYVSKPDRMSVFFWTVFEPFVNKRQ